MQRNHLMSLVAVAFFFVATPLLAERNTRPEDLLGTWNITIKAEGQVFEHVAKVTQDGETLRVEYLTDDIGDQEAVDVKLADNKLAFTIAADGSGGPVWLEFNLKPRGGKLTGKVDYQLGNFNSSTEIVAEREVVGTWNVTIDAEGQVFKPTLVVTNKDGKLAIEFLSDEFGDHEAVDVKLKGNELAFVIAVESPEGGINLKIKTKVAGDQLDGQVEYQVGDITGTTEFKGERETLDTEE